MANAQRHWEPKEYATQEDYDACKRLGHMWIDAPAPEESVHNAQGHPFAMRCVRCTTYVAYWVDWTTGKIPDGARHYYYPKGYQYSGKKEDGPAPRREDYRLEWAQEQRRKRRQHIAIVPTSPDRL